MLAFELYGPRHFSLMRRVAEAPVPAGSPNPLLAFNFSAVLQLIPKGPSDSESKCDVSQARDKSRELRCCLEDEACVVRHHAS